MFVAPRKDFFITTITKRFAFGTAVALAFGLATLAQESNASPSRGGAPNGGPVTPDQTFIKEAADGGLAEVELGQLAVEKSSNEEVKGFAQRMVEDHGKANENLKQLAARKGV